MKKVIYITSGPDFMISKFLTFHFEGLLIDPTWWSVSMCRSRVGECKVWSGVVDGDVDSS